MSKVFNIVVMIAIMMLSVHSYSAESYYKYCSVAGFSEGMDDKLVSSMALQLVLLSGPYDQQCSEQFKSAKQMGQHFDMERASKSKSESLKIFNEYMAFKLRINKGILSSAGYL